MYLVVEWPEWLARFPDRWRPRRTLGPELPIRPPELPFAVWDALRAFDLSLKTIEIGPYWYEGRTRCWHGHPWLASSNKCLRHTTRIEHDDRAQGLYYARELAKLLRAAHRAGFPLTVRTYL